MSTQRRSLATKALRFALPAVVVALVAAPAQAIEWGQVQGETITLFYPGQSPFEWVLTEADHSGGDDIRKGETCRECHQDEERDIGNKIVSGEKLEPDPIAGKRGFIEVEVKTAYDNERFYVRLEWPGPEQDPTRKLDPEFQSKATMLLGDQSIPAYKLTGCWASCHADMEGMPSDPADAEIDKYLARSRTKVTRTGGGLNFKPDGELAQLLADGTFLEYWRANLNPGAAAQPVDGYVLEDRHDSDSPQISAEAEFTGGRWSVVLSRALAADGAGRIALAPGRTYEVGFAIHDNFADGRRHHVSFGRTLVLGQGEADLVAPKQ